MRAARVRLDLARTKNPTPSCPGDRWKWSDFYAIAEFLEFPHHACGARAFGLGTHRWPPFLVADPLMEDHPQHSAGSKNPTHSCPGDRWKWSAFYAIAEFLEFPHHACGARAFGLGTHRWPPFLVADPLMEDHPQHSAESMGDGPDGLLVPQTRQQPAEGQLEYAPFDLYRRLGCLIQQPPHVAIALRRACAVRLPCALFIPCLLYTSDAA